MSPDIVFKGGRHLCSPIFDSSGALHVLSTETGEVFRIESRLLSAETKVFSIGGAPSCLRFGPTGVMHVADMNGRSIMHQVDDEMKPQILEYEGTVFKGPHSCCFDRSGVFYFTDSGPLGETGLRDPKGSIFRVSADGRLLQPLALSCLAYPTGIALSPDDSVLYVCEMMHNRLLRGIQRPAGVFHFSVFHQFSGRLGPSAVAVHPTTGEIFVANYDVADPVRPIPGCITRLSPEGEVLARIAVPAPEISGLTFSTSEPSMLYFTEASTNTVSKVNI